MPDPIAAQATDAAPAPVQPTPVTEPASAPLSNLSQPAPEPTSAQMDALLADAFNAQPVTPTPEQPVEPAPTAPEPSTTPPAGDPPQVTPTVPAAEPAAPVTQPVVTPTDPPVEDARLLPNRISTNQFEPDAQRAMQLQHTLNNGKKPGDAGFVTLKQAYAQLETNDTPVVVTPAAPAAPAPTLALQTKVTEIQGSLAELRQKRSEFAKNEALYGDELATLDTQIETAMDSLSDARTDLKLATRDHEAQQANEAARNQEAAVQERMQAKQAVLARFPSAADPATALGSEIATVVAELKASDSAVLYDSNAAGFIAERAAVRLAERNAKAQGLSFAQAYDALLAKPAAPASQPAAAAPAAQAPRVLPLSSGTATPPPVTKTAADAVAALGVDDWKGAEALLNPSGNQVYALH